MVWPTPSPPKSPRDRTGRCARCRPRTSCTPATPAPKSRYQRPGTGRSPSPHRPTPGGRWEPGDVHRSTIKPYKDEIKPIRDPEKPGFFAENSTKWGNKASLRGFWSRKASYFLSENKYAFNQETIQYLVSTWKNDRLLSHVFFPFSSNAPGTSMCLYKWQNTIPRP